jgi:hypothetical protein
MPTTNQDIAEFFVSMVNETNQGSYDGVTENWRESITSAMVQYLA